MTIEKNRVYYKQPKRNNAPGQKGSGNMRIIDYDTAARLAQDARLASQKKKIPVPAGYRRCALSGDILPINKMSTDKDYEEFNRKIAALIDERCK